MPSPGRYRPLVRRGAPLAVIALLIGGSTAYASSRGGGTAYRTATARLGNVEQVLHLTGQLSPIHQLTAAFPVTGIVATVPVHLGQLVQVGQTLATLDAAPLQDAVVQAQAGLATAQAALVADQSNSAPSIPVASTPVSTSHNTSHTGTASLQSTVTHDLARAAAALRQLTVACAAPTPQATATATTTATARPTPSPMVSSSATMGPSPSGQPKANAGTRGSGSPRPSTGTAGSGSCVAAATATMAAQQQVATDEGRLLKATSSAGNAATSPSASRPASSPALGHSSVGNIARDTADVLTAQATLANANASLAGDVLHSPLTGILAALPFTVGSPTSPAAHAVVIASGAVSAVVSVPGSTIGRLRVGQRATVTPDGSATAMQAAVSAVGLLPSSANPPISYAVTVVAPTAPAGLGSGSTGAVDIVTGTASHVVTLPVSAVTPTGSGGTGLVTVLAGSRPSTPTPVQLGLVGSGLVQITGGLQAGATVVLADLGRPVPTSTVNRKLFGGGGGRGRKFGGSPAGARVPAAGRG